MNRPAVFHIVAAADWDAALLRGTYAPESLVSEGFVHLSYRDQVAATATRYYAAVEQDLVVVEFDRNRFDDDVVDEYSPASGDTFPHLYGPVPTRAATAVHPLRRDDTGGFVFTG